jgi:hypothetical protein
VQLSPEQRSALSTIGNAAIGVGLGMSVLVVAFIVSQFATGQGSVARATPSAPAPLATAAVPVATATPPPSPPPTSSSSPPVAPTESPATTRPTATPSPSPSSSSDALTAEPYSNSGKRYAALRAPVGYTYLAPIAGTVQLRMYQLIDGQVRVGSAVPSLPFFPYLTLESSDRRITFRLGALDADAQVLIKDGERAETGTALFKIVGDGASSWRAFYDRGMTANVVASVAALPSGAELDPVAFFMAR